MKLIQFTLVNDEKIDINIKNVNAIQRGKEKMRTLIWLIGDTEPTVVKQSHSIVKRRLEAGF